MYERFNYRKHLKSSKVFIYINFNTQRKRVLKKIKNSMLKRRWIEIMRFCAKFFVTFTGSRHVGEMKTTSGHQGTLQFFWNGERFTLKNSNSQFIYLILTFEIKKVILNFFFTFNYFAITLIAQTFIIK